MFSLIDPVISTALMCGMWWLAPTLAASCATCMDKFRAGTWARESRVACKITGACALFKMPLEAKKIRAAIVQHWFELYPPKRGDTFKRPFVGMIKFAAITFKNAINTPVWTEDIANNMFILSAYREHCLAFYLVQIGCILVRRGLTDTLVFKLFEARMNTLIATTQPHVDGVMPLVWRSLTFRRVIDEVLAHEQLSARFLSSFNYIESFDLDTLAMLPYYEALVHFMLHGNDNRKAVVDCINRMPGCILGCIAYVFLFNAAMVYPRHGLQRNLYIFFNTFDRYIQSKNDAHGKWIVSSRNLDGRIYKLYEYEVEGN